MTAPNKDPFAAKAANTPKDDASTTEKDEAAKASTSPDLNAPDADKVKTESTSAEAAKAAPAKKTTKAAKPAAAKKPKKEQIKREDFPATVPAAEDGTYFATVSDRLGHTMVSVRAELWVGEAPLNVSLAEAKEVHALLGEVIERTQDLA